MKTSKFLFICVNYNNSFYTEKFCNSLASQSGFQSEFEIDCVVVDNSTDVADSARVSEIAAKHPWVRYLHPGKNLGYFGGLNHGIRQSPVQEYDYVAICNNDLVFEPDFCAALRQGGYEPRVHAVCPDVITKDGLHQNPHVAERMGRWRRFQLDVYFCHYYFAWLLLLILRIFRPVKSSPPQPAARREIHMGIGACYILTRSFFAHFKDLSYPHFLYGEEAYFSDQIHSANGILLFDPALRVHHAESATLSKLPKRTTYEFARTGYSNYRKML